MRKALLAGLALAAVCVAGSSRAADMRPAPAYQPLPPPAPAANWTGCYVGALAGGVGGVSNYGGQSWGAGVLVGGTLGCNYQIDHLVFGIEGEGYWSNLEVNSNLTGGGFGSTNSTKNPWTANVAVRLGLAYDRFFIYDKTGITFGRFEFATNNFGTPATYLSGSETITGVIQGIGLEYMITPQWSAKGEFALLIYSSRDVNVTCTPSVACAPTSTTSSQPQLQGVGKIGLNYKFY